MPRVTVELRPNARLGDEIEQEEETRLQHIKLGMTGDEILKVLAPWQCVSDSL